MYPGINQAVVKQQSPVALGYPEFPGSPWIHSWNKITLQTKKKKKPCKHIGMKFPLRLLLFNAPVSQTYLAPPPPMSPISRTRESNFLPVWLHAMSPNSSFCSRRKEFVYLNTWPWVSAFLGIMSPFQRLNEASSKIYFSNLGWVNEVIRATQIMPGDSISSAKSSKYYST